MAEATAQLIMTAMICSLVGFTLFVLIYGEARQRKHARSVARLPSAPEMRSSVDEHSTAEAKITSPGHTKQTDKGEPFEHAGKLSAEREDLRQRGFTHTQIDRLITYRAAYRAGHYQLDVLLPDRLRFARWLYQQGKING